jgi:hypothetical protein
MKIYPIHQPFYVFMLLLFETFFPIPTRGANTNNVQLQAKDSDFLMNHQLLLTIQETNF